MNNGVANTRADRPKVSIVTPFYNEEAGSQRFFEEVFATTSRLETPVEFICVEDGSQDNTLEKLLAAAREEPRMKVLALSRNFGKESALVAGIEAATGDVVILIDADLQDPPGLIKEMLQRWREGYDIVYGVRRSRKQDSWMKRMTAGSFYRIFNSLTSVPVPENAGDFRLFDRRVADHLRQMPERTRFSKGMFAWLGYKSTAVYYDRPKRERGHTSWSYWKLWNFALDGVTSFSTVPLRVWTYTGLAVSLLSFAYASFLVLRTLIMGVDLPGYASLMVVILFLGGVQLISLGVIGEYLGRVFIEVKQRPIYLVERVYHFPANGTELK
ncbi:MAG: glycosyltransferase family 2 protein [Pseudomonadota bacterium]